jgi:hypothetical protein
MRRFLLECGFVRITSVERWASSQVSPLRGMDSRDDKKQVEAMTSAEVVPDLDMQDCGTTAERISVHYTIAAAAFGLISDGCEFLCMTASYTRFD